MGARIIFAMLLTFIYGTLVGHGVHWLLHQQWSGVLHRSHMNHHLKQYPPADMLSDKYRSSGSEDGIFFFTPIIGLAFLLYAGCLSLAGLTWPLILGCTIEGLFIGWLHDIIHEHFHLKTSPLLHFTYFKNLRSIHAIHHQNMRRNLGIFWFGWDRLFRSFRR